MCIALLILSLSYRHSHLPIPRRRHFRTFLNLVTFSDWCSTSCRSSGSWSLQDQIALGARKCDLLAQSVDKKPNASPSLEVPFDVILGFELFLADNEANISIVVWRQTKGFLPLMAAMP